MILAENMITVTNTGAIGIGVGGIALIIGAAVTWGAVRNRIEVVERSLAEVQRRLHKIESWQQREIGARSGNRPNPSEDTHA